MPRIVFEASEAGPALSVEEPAGGRLVDICDDASAPIPFSCRGASCATCRIEILEGAELLEAPDAVETELLEAMREPPGRRLACSAKVRGGSGLLRLRSVDD
jgi:ferredoxin